MNIFLKILEPKMSFFQCSILTIVIISLLLGCESDKEFENEVINISNEYKLLKDKFVSLATSLKQRDCIKEKNDSERYVSGLNSSIITINEFKEKKKSKDDFDSIGLKMKLKKYEEFLKDLDKSCNSKDSDGDGIPDIKDECDTLAAETSHGCPDPDKDGFYNNDSGTKIDSCPKIKGVKELKGCPQKIITKRKDDDGDGIINSQDACPNDGGFERNDGCPDRDRDGFYDVQPVWESLKDKFDLCVGTPGSFNGCLDDDRDNVHDGIDKCLGEYGALPNGCPCKQDVTPFDLPLLSLRANCKSKIITDNLMIQPKFNVLFKDFILYGSNSGDVVFSLKNNTTGETLINNSSTYVNSHPAKTQVLASNQLLKAGSRYELIVEAKGSDFTLLANSCKTNFSTNEVQLNFKTSAFIHQINFCK